jgi:hypothetical protein
VKYTIKKVVEEVDMLSLSQEEYNKLNEFYYEIIANRFPQLAKDKQIYDIKRIIMTDDLSRAEVVIAVEGKEPEKLRTPGFGPRETTIEVETPS